ncbi:hypothetical protein DIPPA_22617 [Diplonema papillatum]|nr:hypothetical protein DIPPA_22617 [Diplonema papillatum]
MAVVAVVACEPDAADNDAADNDATDYSDVAMVAVVACGPAYGSYSASIR